jgi:hypothetical protein
MSKKNLKSDSSKDLKSLITEKKYNKEIDSYTSKLWIEGWLIKEGSVVKNWKKRYFVVKGGTIYYYKGPNKQESDLKVFYSLNIGNFIN